MTGGARGIGYSLAGAFAAGGMRVAVVDVLDSVEAAAASLASDYGVVTLGVRADVRSQASVESAFARVREALGLPTVLLTAAGITVWNDSVDVSEEEWRRVMGVNLDGTFFAAQSFGRGLIRSGRAGSAVFIASISASIVNVPQHQASYNASKAAVAHLAGSLAVEWARYGIRVNAVSPGYILSDMTRRFTDANPGLTREWVGRIPAGRMGDPSDLRGLAAFLASDASAYLTGQNIVIDGGYTAV